MDPTVKIFDSGCSINMSGVRNRNGGPGRIQGVKKIEVKIKGVGNIMEAEVWKGINEDGKDELYVEGMDERLVLLSANQYAADGAVVLFEDDGVVLKMDASEKEDLRKHIQRYELTKRLEVENSTYRVLYEIIEEEEDFAMAANTYFNTKINVSDEEERVLAYMLSGLTWDMMNVAIGKGVFTGLHPGITKTVLERFSRKWGKTPDILQMAHPNITGNQKGYMSQREEVKEVGYLQADFMSYDFNEIGEVINTRESIIGGRKTKMKTLGGAVAAFVVVDEFSRFCIGRLVKSVAKPMELIREIMGELKTYGHEIKSFASDAGVSSSSEFRVMTGEVDQYLRNAGIRIIKSDPHNHQNGTPIVERMVQSIKLKMRMAFQYVLKNENIQRLKFTKIQLMKLWGEIFYWSIEVENLRISEGDDSKTRKEMVTRMKPNIQDVRLLPIFAVVKVYRHDTKVQRDGNVTGSFYQHGLYVGPCPYGRGVIRVAVMVNREVFVLRTSKYKGVSDGGDAEEYAHLEQGINFIVSDCERSSKQDTRLIHADYAEWSEYQDGECFVDAYSGKVVKIQDTPVDGFAAVTQGVPRSLKEALVDPIWGEPARKELHTLTNQMMTLIPIKDDDARELIHNGADKVMLFPIYEKKLKAGVEVFKVRLVCNGKTQFSAENTYSPTPTRVELFILMAVVATYDWECAHLDEIRAFLSSTYKGNVPVVAMIKGLPGRYRVRGALYGLRSSPRDYREEVLKRLTKMGFERIAMSQCVFTRRGVIVYEFVDDFVLVGAEESLVKEVISEYRGMAETTDPVWDPRELLGHEMSRDREKKVIRLGTKAKILAVVEAYGKERLRKWKTPMGSHQYLVKGDELDALGESGRELDDEERREYQSLVGSLGWFSGVRHDIGFSFQYLSGFGRNPRVHHMKVAERVLGYLWGTCEMTLDLGGEELDVVAMSDASYGTGKNGRSILGYLVKIGACSGAVASKSMMSGYVRLSTFEAELEALTAVTKMVKWVKLLICVIIGEVKKAVIYVDNETTISFVNNVVEVKAARHMELRMYWVREEIGKGNVRVEYMEGEILPADMLTKVVSRTRFRGFLKDLQGGGICNDTMNDDLDSDDDDDIVNNNLNIGGRRRDFPLTCNSGSS